MKQIILTLAMIFGVCSGIYGQTVETMTNDSLQAQENRVKMDKALLDARRRAEIIKSIEEFIQDFDDQNIKAVTARLKNLEIPGDDVFGEGTDSISGASVRAERFIEKIKEMMSHEAFKSEIGDIVVFEHPGSPGIYGVNFRQKIHAGDEILDGWYFFMIDARGGMSALVCTWQSNENVMKNGVFTLDDFFLP